MESRARRPEAGVTVPVMAGQSEALLERVGGVLGVGVGASVGVGEGFDRLNVSEVEMENTTSSLLPVESQSSTGS